ncbi:51c20eb7-778a-4016-b170-7e771b4dabe8 [Thermothielavioides terrestris]|uniref:51c20eb7-778a-4016-b170-7e771b4dabe8 n=1 Tax=Thermothielavioides terrestris TaxID=2587410 RepID=A0A3S4AP61_9PEZI|nr:51c20eb7-778a-4016-b170-7e771b4dabe8 [Thermothielavioides terrestris]
MHPSILDTSIIDLLEADPRPSLIVALAPHSPTVVYTNPAFARYPALLDLIASHGDDCRPLWEWITASSGPPGPEATERGGRSACSFSYSDIYWTKSVVHEQMVVIGANEQIPLSQPPSQPPYKVRLGAADPQPSNGSTPRRIMPVEVDLAAAPVENQALSLPLSDPDRRVRFGPALAPGSSPTSNPKERPPSRAGAVQSLGRSISDPGWILPDTTPEQRPFLDHINSVDWAATPLGPMRGWLPKLEETVNQILVDSRPIAIYWGPSYITIYNEAFSKLCGSKHPVMLGMPVQEAWAEAGQRLRDTMRAISPNQKGPVEDEWRFFVEREPEVEGGPPLLEETYLKWSIIPIVEDNVCLGFMQPVAETTSLRLWERRMKMLIDLGEVLVTARDVHSYWGMAIQQLGTVEPRYDIPLAIMYSVEDDPDATASPSSSGGPAKICRLQGTLGVPENHPIAPESLNLRTSNEALSSSFRAALASEHPTLIQTSDGTWPPSLLEGLQWRGFEGDRCRAAVICPIRPTKEEDAMGLLLLGLNPRRPYDNDYRQYIALLSQKLATSLASVVLLEEEAKRGRNAAEQAAVDQAMLKEKLEVQTKEANESMQMFETVAEFVPVGMCFGDPEGNITYANDAWYRITGYPGACRPIANQGFLACVLEEDRPKFIAEYEKLKTTGNVEFEFRVKRQANAASPVLSGPLTRTSPSFEKAGFDLSSLENPKERHVLATARAEYANGNVIRVLTCLTDVTAHRRAAEEAVRRAQQAENLKRMAEFATVGMYDMDLDGRLIGANKVFFEMCGLEKVDPAEVDLRPFEICLEKMVREDKVQNVEVRLNTTWTPEDGPGHKVVVPRWVQATLMPVRTTEGVVQSFTGCLSDVSLQKWQLDWEKERKEEAIESKRQQENFIDMTSHEMRNPLSAIIHCADAITATLSRVQQLLGGGVSYWADNRDAGSSSGANASQEWLAEARGLVDNAIDTAETILGCAQHQKRIVDDILTMSKLDSSLLSITRVTVDPIKMVKEALKMFEVEARRVDINLSMVVDSSYHDLNIKFLDFDPSRLKQVLINLLTNALKFTKTGPMRNVTVAVSASLVPPTEATSKVQFIPRSPESVEQMIPSNRADTVFLLFEVEDTGEGLTEEEKKSLFQRFVQASSRTHVKYGGSGLGLFISRRLTELQNGSIGVASQPGVGSTFAFYIEAYRPNEAAFREAEAAGASTQSALSLQRAGPSLSRRGSHKTRAGSNSTLDSESGKGTTSAGSISGASPTASAAVTPSSEINISLSPTLAPPAPQIKGVLVVEDNLINQQITRRGLLNMGFTVDVANHGVECLDKLRRTDRYRLPVPAPFAPSSSSSTSSNPLSSPSSSSSSTTTQQQQQQQQEEEEDEKEQQHAAPFPLSMILMDIEMPIQDGLTCTRNIRELERAGRIVGGRIPIIAVSANARMEQVREAKEAGCDDVLVKPYRMPELLERMRLVMSRVVVDGGLGGGGEEAVRRITLFKVPDEDKQLKLVKAYRTMKKKLLEQEKKRSILLLDVAKATDDPRSKGYTVAAIMSFGSMADMEEYEECPAHKALQEAAKGLVAEPPLVVVLEGETDVTN